MLHTSFMLFFGFFLVRLYSTQLGKCSRHGPVDLIGWWQFASAEEESQEKEKLSSEKSASIARVYQENLHKQV